MAAPKEQTSKHGSGHRHPPELRERAVRMVEETIKQTGQTHGVVTRVAVQLGLVRRLCVIGSSRLRSTAADDRGSRPKNSSTSPSWRKMSASCGGPMKSSRRRQVSLRGSSTRDSCVASSGVNPQAL